MAAHPGAGLLLLQTEVQKFSVVSGRSYDFITLRGITVVFPMSVEWLSEPAIVHGHLETCLRGKDFQKSLSVMVTATGTLLFERKLRIPYSHFMSNP